ncbi:MAG TPA: hypothetical protein VIP30_15795 [Stenotrophomonas sp.]
MKIHHVLLAGLVASVSGAAFAHDPSLHEEYQKPKPTACEHLSQPGKYDIDLADPTTKALKASCDGKKQEATKK